MTLPYSDEHRAFRRTVRRFVETEIVPRHAEWEREGVVPRSLWLHAGRLGMLLPNAPAEYGGGGGDFLFSVIVAEELLRVGATGPFFQLHSDIVAPYIVHHGTEAQRRAWLPRLASGEAVAAIAMTEPGAGSDLAGIRMVARRDGDEYVLSGQKTFISNGQLADLVVVAAKTDLEAGARGVSLFLVEATRPGFRRGRRLEKAGMHAQDTSELFFDDVRVPAANLLGEEGGGFACMMRELAQERLVIAVGAVAAAEAALEWTVEHVSNRRAFGAPLSDKQHVRFTLAEAATEARIGRVFADWCVGEHLAGRLDTPTASMAKYWLTEMQFRVLDTCVQLHGGYGYMQAYPVARAWADARVQRIYGGTTEIMKEIIGRALFADRLKKD